MQIYPAVLAGAGCDNWEVTLRQPRTQRWLAGGIMKNKQEVMMRHAVPVAMAALMLALATAGCGGHTAGKTSATGGASSLGKPCGTATTAANVPVIVEVPGAAVGCAEALRVQREYTRKLAAGQAPGNGGGGPVPVDGWVCEGYPTPQVLRTGRASECHRGTVTFYAVLPPPTASPAS